ncbi:MAG TPA: hypothetical protein VIM79_24535, partial [Niastella sp.]
MRKLYFLLVCVTTFISTVTHAQTISIAALNTPYNQSFNSLAFTGTSATVPAGWFFFENGAAGAAYTANNGASNSGDTYSYGVTGNTERAFGCLLSGSVTPVLGASFTNNTGATITTLTVSYTGEQWRLGAAGRVDRLDFQ